MTTAMTKGGHARAVLALGAPLAGSHLAQNALHITDTVMLGWYGVAELAAGVIGTSMFFVVFVIGAGFAHAVMPMVSAAMGAGDEVQVRRAARMGLWLCIGFGLVVYPLFWFSEPILLFLGQTPEVAALARDFLQIAGLGLVPALLVMVLKSYLAALKRTQVVLWATVAAVFVNTALGWALIFGRWGAPELGVRGAAIASVAVQAFTLILLLAYAVWLPELRKYRLLQRLWRPDWGAMRLVFRLGWPIGLTSFAETGLFVASALMMGWIGTMELAAHGITIQAVSATFMLHLGLSNAATVRAGWAFGAGDWPALREGAVVAVTMSLILAVAIILCFVAMPEAIIAVFLDAANPDSATIMAYGAGLLMIAALFQLADALQVMALGLLRGIQDTKVPMAMAAVSYWLIGIPVSYLLGFRAGLGGTGIWLGLVIGLTVAAGLLMWRFRSLSGRF